MSPKSDPRLLDSPPPGRIVPLESGDRLSRAEFERRYEAMPGLRRAELIEGVVQVPSPTRHEQHGRPHAALVWWLTSYQAATPGTEVSADVSLRLDLDNEPQPDALLRIHEARGGRSLRTADDYIEGPPELVVEVAASSASHDLHAKLDAYRRNGVLEYIVWRTLDGEVDWFVLEEGEYRSLGADAQGRWRSRAFPGLWLDARSLLEHDLAAVGRFLGEGLETPEHGAFVARLEGGR